jgi:hypothetical protein
MAWWEAQSGFGLPRLTVTSDPPAAHPVSCLPPAQSLLAIGSDPLADGSRQNLGNDFRLGSILCNRHQPEILGDGLRDFDVQGASGFSPFRPTCRWGRRRGLRLCCPGGGGRCRGDRGPGRNDLANRQT